MTITTEPARTTAGSDFAVLSRRVAAEGLMTRRPAYYAVRLPIVALMLAGVPVYAYMRWKRVATANR